MVQVEAVLGIKQWGNYLGVRLPVNVAHAAHLHLTNEHHWLSACP
jgi:antitoxin MazE